MDDFYEGKEEVMRVGEEKKQEREQCFVCSGTGLNQHGDNCRMCNGLGFFIKVENKDIIFEGTIPNEIFKTELKSEKKETILEEAARLVSGGRQEDYGSPEDNFATIANMWNAYLNARPPTLMGSIQPKDVAIMMVLLKCAREANRPKRDNLADGAGYFQCASWIAGFDDRRKK